MDGPAPLLEADALVRSQEAPDANLEAGVEEAQT
jgi:hypothetical protein